MTIMKVKVIMMMMMSLTMMSTIVVTRQNGITCQCLGRPVSETDCACFQGVREAARDRLCLFPGRERGSKRQTVPVSRA